MINVTPPKTVWFAAGVLAMMVSGTVLASTMPLSEEPGSRDGSTPESVRTPEPADAPLDVSGNEDVDSDSEVRLGEAQVPVNGIRKDVAVVGEVVGHPAGKVLLTTHDVLTVKLMRSREGASGQRYAVARRAQFVEHPESGRDMGYVVRIVGTIELDQAIENRWRGSYWSARVVGSVDYVTLEDWLIPYEPAAAPSAQAAGEMSGWIVAVHDELELTAESQVVYTDLGANQGVRSGDRYSVVRDGSRGSRGEPDRVIGVLRVMATLPASSSATVVRSTEPVQIGDRLVRLTADPEAAP